jgi:hypothetical protein
MDMKKMIKFDPSKPVQFLDAPEKVRILATNFQSEFPIVIAVLRDDGTEEIRGRRADGRVYPDKYSSHDLVNVPEKHEVWINLYHTENVFFGCAYPTREQANAKANIDRIACVRIKFTEGEGL